MPQGKACEETYTEEGIQRGSERSAGLDRQIQQWETDTEPTGANVLQAHQ